MKQVGKTILGKARCHAVVRGDISYSGGRINEKGVNESDDAVF